MVVAVCLERARRGRRVAGVALGHGVVARDRAELRVGVAVAVDVLQHDVAAELLVAPDLLDLAVVDRDHGGAGGGEDVDRAPRLRGLDHLRRVLAALDALEQLLLCEVVGVAGASVDGEAAFGEPGQRADQVRRDAGDQTRAQEHAVDVPVGVVVGPDRGAHVVLVVGCLEVLGSGEDRVHRVVGVLAPVLVGVDAVGRPGRGHELHPAEGAGARDVQVASVVGLDLVDRGQDLPANAVLDSGRLIDREQEGRDPELADDEVRNARGGRRARQRIDEAGVAGRRRAVGVAKLRAAVAIALAVLLGSLILSWTLRPTGQLALLLALAAHALAAAALILLRPAAGARGAGLGLGSGGRGLRRRGRGCGRCDRRARKLDVVDGCARRNVHLDDLAARQPDGDRLGCGRDGERGERGHDESRRCEQGAEEPRLHPA